MRSKYIFLLLSIFISVVSVAQTTTASVEKSVFGVHTGLIGVWVNGEFKLARKIALRAEVGAELGTVTYDGAQDSEFLLVPVLSVEPRWYYNLDKRARKGNIIANNSANAISINFKYSPDQYLTSSDDMILIPHQIAIVPSWGIRRVYGKHFTFEFGAGAGPLIAFGDDKPGVVDANDYFIDLKVRIGYTF